MDIKDFFAKVTAESGINIWVEVDEVLDATSPEGEEARALVVGALVAGLDLKATLEGQVWDVCLNGAGGLEIL